MAEKSDDRNLMVEFTAEGQVRPSVRASEHLRKLGGLWRLVPEVGQMMLLERVGAADGKSTSRHVVLAGTFSSNNDLHNALSMISMGQQDGALHVTNGDHQKVLYFRKGVLLSARSSLPEDRLGNLLVRVGLLTAEERDLCLPEVRAGQPLGNVLVSKGIMTTSKVYDGLRAQTEEIFFSILPWQNGAFYLVAPLNVSEVPAMLHLDTNALLMDGVRRLDEGEGEDDSVRRLDPVSIKELPKDGPELIVETYNKAMRVLFASVGAETAERLRTSVGDFIAESLPFHELFFGVELSDVGELSAKALISNVGSNPSEASIRNMQLGLTEVLFFALFAAGEEVTTELEHKIQRDVAEQLQALPAVQRRDPAAPRSPTDFAETSRVDLVRFAAKADARAAKEEPVDDEMIAGIFDENGDEEALGGDSTAVGIPAEVLAEVEAEEAAEKKAAGEKAAGKPVANAPAADEQVKAAKKAATKKATKKNSAKAKSKAEPPPVPATKAATASTPEPAAADADEELVQTEEFTSLAELVPPADGELDLDVDGELELDDQQANRTEDSVIAAIVDEEYSVEHTLPGELMVEPITGPEHSEPILLGQDEPDESFELSLDQDEEIMSLLDKVTEATAEEAAARSQAGPLPTAHRTPSSEFDRMLSDNDDEDEPIEADKSAP